MGIPRRVIEVEADRRDIWPVAFGYFHNPQPGVTDRAIGDKQVGLWQPPFGGFGWCLSRFLIIIPEAESHPDIATRFQEETLRLGGIQEQPMDSLKGAGRPEVLRKHRYYIEGGSYRVGGAPVEHIPGDVIPSFFSGMGIGIPFLSESANLF